jgi:hypothetical protein
MKGGEAELNTLSAWEAQTTELVRLIDEEIKESERKVKELLAERNSLVRALKIYRQRIGARYAKAMESLRPQDFQGKTIREALQLIAERNDKIIVVKDATKLLREAKIFGTPEHADSMVYSILGRSPEFVRIGKGIFRLNGAHQKEKAIARKAALPGLKQAILELKTMNPDMTKDDAVNTLIRRGFDFQGKSPKRAVHITWVNMGYMKKEKLPDLKLLPIIESLRQREQQDLFGENP